MKRVNWVKRLATFIAIAGFSIIFVTFLFAGGSKESTNTSSKAAAPTTITLRFPHWFFSHGADFEVWLNGAVDSFEKQNPNVHVDRIPVAFATYWDKLETEVGAGDAPDVAAFGPTDFAKFVGQGTLLPLNDLINMSDIKKNFSVLQTQAIPALAPDGKTYGLAYDSGFYLPEYRPSVFKEAGISSYAATPDQFVQMAKQLTNKSRFGYAFMDVAGDYHEEAIDLIIWSIGLGGNWYDSHGMPTLNSPVVIQAVTYLKKLYDLNVTPRDTDKGTYRKMFALGKVGTLIDGAWLYGQSTGWVPATKNDFAAANLPFPTQRVASFFECNGILKGTKHPKEAAKLLETITDVEQSKRLAEITLLMPPRVSVFTPEFRQQLVAKWPWYKTFIDHANSKDMVLNTPLNMPGQRQDQVQKIWGKYFDKVLFENMAPAAAMNAAQKEAMALFK